LCWLWHAYHYAGGLVRNAKEGAHGRQARLDPDAIPGVPGNFLQAGGGLSPA